ncbi:MAG: hypothetical protein ABR518_04590 [Actinomycetota bacterium]
MDRREIEQLWAVPLGDFTRTRDDLAKKAKEEGDGEAAREIKSRRKPTVAGWAVNQLARERSADLRRLLSLGDVLRKAQREAFEGGGRDALRTATSERRRVIDQLVEAAGDLLEAAGHGRSRAVLDKVGETLMATATDEETAGLVAEGSLQREATAAAGLDELSALIPTGGRAPSRTTTKAKPATEHPERTKRAEERARRLEEEAAGAEEESRKLRGEADRLAREAERAHRAAERAEKRASQARQRADRARREGTDGA